MLLHGFPGLRRTAQNSMALIFRHMSIIIFREQVNAPAQLVILYKAAMTEPRSIAFPRIVKIQMEHLKLS